MVADQGEAFPTVDLNLAASVGGDGICHDPSGMRRRFDSLGAAGKIRDQGRWLAPCGKGRQFLDERQFHSTRST